MKVQVGPGAGALAVGVGCPNEVAKVPEAVAHRLAGKPEGRAGLGDVSLSMLTSGLRAAMQVPTAGAFRMPLRADWMKSLIAVKPRVLGWKERVKSAPGIVVTV